MVVGSRRSLLGKVLTYYFPACLLGCLTHISLQHSAYLVCPVGVYRAATALFVASAWDAG